MATTTNYGWATPDDTDLVKDGAAAIRTLGSSIDTSFIADEGDLLLGGTSDIFEPLAIGAAATVLTSDGTTASWVAPAGGGKVLQVISATYSTQTNVSSTSYTDTGLSLAITPSSATSKVLVFVSQNLFVRRETTVAGGALRLLRDSTSIIDTSGNGFYSTAYITTSNQTVVELAVSSPIIFLDSPNTTSSVTYKTQQRAQTTANSGTTSTQLDSATSTITLLEIGA